MLKKTPEQQELDKKLAELATLETALAERELELATLQAELHAFEQEYMRVVGIRYAKLDQIEAEIAKFLVFLNPQDVTARQKAEKARVKAQGSKRAVSDTVTNSQSSQGFKPAENLKKLYREVAKRIHPDLATDEVERLRRHKLMTEANQAYENGDEQLLRSILDAWENSPESVKGEGVAEKLIRVIRKIAQVRERFQAIQLEIQGLKRSPLYQLKKQVIVARQQKYDLLAEMAFQIDKQIATAKVWLKNLIMKVGACA